MPLFPCYTQTPLCSSDSHSDLQTALSPSYPLICDALYFVAMYNSICMYVLGTCLCFHYFLIQSHSRRSISPYILFDFSLYRHSAIFWRKYYISTWYILNCFCLFLSRKDLPNSFFVRSAYLNLFYIK